MALKSINFVVHVDAVFMVPYGTFHIVDNINETEGALVGFLHYSKFCVHLHRGNFRPMVLHTSGSGSILQSILHCRDV